MRTLLIDNHDSYTYNLFHLLGQVNGREPDVVTNDVGELPDLDRYDNVLISPGPGHPARPRDFGISSDVLSRPDLPVLGVCLGHQGIAAFEGAEVVRAPRPRHGHVSRVTHQGDDLFRGIPAAFGAVRYHSLCVAEPLPPDLEATARSEDGVVQALRHRRLPRWGVQFHPESIETEHGLRLMANFRDLSRSVRGATTGGRKPAPRKDPAPVPPGSATAPPRRYRLHVRELPLAVDTEAAFRELYAASAHAFWLDSARVEDGLSRFSFLGDADGPLAETVRYRTDEKLVVVDGAKPSVHRESVLDYLQRELARRDIAAPPLPFDFTGGYVGYFGYELKADCGSPNAHTASTPDAVWLFADRFLCVDHHTRRTYLLALSESGHTRPALEWLERTAERLRSLTPLDPPPRVEPAPVEPRLALDRAAYVRAVEDSQAHLHAGESYEVCLTNVAELPAHDGSWDTYRRLRRLNPAPYAAYLQFGDLDVACSSPERFLRITQNGTAETKPIKGTAPRGATPAEDAAIREELISSAKTRAENLMIVDLLRNDLGRVCAVGTVDVPSLMAAESYATVHQLVSTVRGDLKNDADAVDCVRACFPGGSMTGAPKLRTLEIIESLESRARGVYSGSLGYLACNGAADLNIVIRTMVRHGDHWQVGAGGAIVLDSDPDGEYEEMLLKAQAPTRALRAHPPSAAAAAAPAETNGSDLA